LCYLNNPSVSFSLPCSLSLFLKTLDHFSGFSLDLGYWMFWIKLINLCFLQSPLGPPKLPSQVPSLPIIEYTPGFWPGKGNMASFFTEPHGQGENFSEHSSAESTHGVVLFLLRGSVARRTPVKTSNSSIRIVPYTCGRLPFSRRQAPPFCIPDAACFWRRGLARGVLLPLRHPHRPGRGPLNPRPVPSPRFARRG